MSNPCGVIPWISPDLMRDWKRYQQTATVPLTVMLPASSVCFATVMPCVSPWSQIMHLFAATLTSTATLTSAGGATSPAQSHFFLLPPLL